MFKLKHPTAKDIDLEEAKKTIEYYKVPLTEAVFSRQSKNLGFVNAVKNKVREYKELTEDVFAGDTELKEKYERDNDELYNKFDLYDKDRGALISQKGVGFFETHLEIVFNQALVAYTKQQVSRKYVPIFKAMQLIFADRQLTIKYVGAKGKDFGQYKIASAVIDGADALEVTDTKVEIARARLESLDDSAHEIVVKLN